MKLERGFSLLEALVALVILSAAMATTFVWIDGSLKQTERVKKSNQAIDQNILERLSFYPSKHTITRTFCERNLGENIQSVSLTPDSNFAPWELDYYLNLAESQTLDENLFREDSENNSKIPKRYPLFSE